MIYDAMIHYRILETALLLQYFIQNKSNNYFYFKFSCNKLLTYEGEKLSKNKLEM